MATITFVEAMLYRPLFHPLSWVKLDEALDKLRPYFELNKGIGEDSPLFMNKDAKGSSGS